MLGGGDKEGDGEGRATAFGGCFSLTKEDGIVKAWQR